MEVEEKRSNILLFPRGKKGAPPQSFEEILNNVQATRDTYSRNEAENISRTIFLSMAENGLRFNHEDGVAHDMMLVYEAILSLHHKLVGLEHPLQTAANNMFSIEDSEGYVDYFLDEEEFYL